MTALESYREYVVKINACVKNNTELPKIVTDLLVEQIKIHTRNILMSVPPKYKNLRQSCGEN